MEEIREISKKVQQESIFIQELRREISKVIVGQDELVDRMLVAILGNGHVLLEGVPGLAKTLLIKTLAQTISADFQRVQFTPDLLPADVTGTLIFNPKDGAFSMRKGPIFSNLILADEINRAPAKVQSALLEAMQERQVTIGDSTFTLPPLFMVMATQNPIEQEGTYPLPEAQVDRFMLKLNVTYPSKADEKLILERMSSQKIPAASKIVSQEQILSSRAVADSIYMDDKIKNYIVEIVFATRQPQEHRMAEIAPWILYGASPRATIYLAQAAKAYAFLNGRGYVTPEDVKTIGFDVLRHRIILTYEAEAENINSEAILKRIFETVEVP